MKHPQEETNKEEQEPEANDLGIRIIDGVVLLACVAFAVLIVYMLLTPVSPPTEPIKQGVDTTLPKDSTQATKTPQTPINQSPKPRVYPPPIKAGAHQIPFRQGTYDALVLNKPGRRLQLYWTDDNGRPFKSIERLRNYLATKGDSLIFATNAGMYQPDNSPQGLYIEDYIEKAPLETRDSGYGNFYLQPNGVFAFNEQEAVVLERKQFEANQQKWKFATQSGPMLVIDGKIHPVFQAPSKSIHYRNGVGITREGRLVMAISNQRVNLYTFAAFFRDTLGCDNALYLDGAISSLFFPRLNRFDLKNNLGPMLGICLPKKEKETSAAAGLRSGSYYYKEKTFDVLLYKRGEDNIRFFLRDTMGQAYASFESLKEELDQKGDSLLFAMNAGSYNKLLEPEGLYIDEGDRLGFLNLLPEGKGNFYLQPNGIFMITDERFDIFPSLQLAEPAYYNQNILFATQSGPLLIDQNQFHPAIKANSTNRHLRNGVGLIDEQTVAFVISNEPVNFYELAAFFKEQLYCKQALCLDGVVSSMYAPEIGRNDLDNITRLGPIMAISRKK